MTTREKDLGIPAIGAARPNLLFALLIRFLAAIRRRPSCNPVDMLDERGLKDIGLDAGGGGPDGCGQPRGCAPAADGARRVLKGKRAEFSAPARTERFEGNGLRTIWLAKCDQPRRTAIPSKGDRRDTAEHRRARDGKCDSRKPAQNWTSQRGTQTAAPDRREAIAWLRNGRRPSEIRQFFDAFSRSKTGLQNT